MAEYVGITQVNKNTQVQLRLQADSAHERTYYVLLLRYFCLSGCLSVCFSLHGVNGLVHAGKITYLTSKLQEYKSDKQCQ